MTEPQYRLQTEQGLSKQYSLSRLKEKHAAGVVDEAVQCTVDDGDTWMSLADVLSDADASAKRMGDRDPVNSESATIAQSETAVDMTVDGDEDADMSLRSQSRKLRRLPAGSGNGKLAKLKAAREERKAATGQISQPEDLIGVSLANDRYKIVSKLGKGSMAYVLRASDSRLLTDVVVKVPKPEKMTDDDIRDRFRRESQLLVQLTHPHVVKVLDVGEYQDLPYVVMQLLSGGTLTELINAPANNGKGMAPDSLKTWLREVGRALDFCYRKGMVHRDVKPANILFDEDNNAYVSDFGLTKIMYGDHDNIDPSDTASGVVLGTPNYISPEVVLGKGYDGRADQYSLGITVYHAMFGKAPMQGDNATATMINQTTKQLQLLSDIRSDIPRELALAVRKSIEKKPEKRFDTCEEFSEAVIEGLRAPLGKSAPVPAPQADWDAQEVSSQSSVRRRRPKNRNSSKSSRSGRVVAPSNPDNEWLDLASEPEAAPLPRRKNKSKSSKKTKKGKQTSGSTVIFGQEVHPGLVIGLGIGVCALVLSIIVRWAMSSDTEEAANFVKTNTADVNSDNSAQNNDGNGNQGGSGSPTDGNSENTRQNRNGGDQAANKNGRNRKNGTYSSGVVNGENSNSGTGQNGTPPSNSETQTSTDLTSNQNDSNAKTATSNADSANAMSTGAAPTTTSPNQEPSTSVAMVPDTTGLNGTDTTTVSNPTPLETTSTLELPWQPGQSVTLGSVDCPVIVLGNQVWDKSTKSAAATLDGDYDPRAYTTLSHDGKYFAAAMKAPGLLFTNVAVWDTTTGSRLFTADGKPDRYSDAILLSEKSLYVGGKWKDDILTWDLTNGNSRKAIKVAAAQLSAGSVAISSDGEFVAMVSNGHLGVVSTQSGKPVATMKSPGDRPRNDRSGSAGTEEGNEKVYDSLLSLQFSPDGAELAGVATHSQPRVLAWNGQGDLTVDRTLNVNLNSDDSKKLQWFSEGNAWLIAGRIVDKDSGRILLATDAAGDSIQLYDNDRLVGAWASAPDRIVVKDIPWAAIREALSSLDDPTAAMLSPASPVGINVNIEYRPEIEGNIRRALSKRLASDDIKTEDSQQTTLFRVTGKVGIDQLLIELIHNHEIVWQSTLQNVGALDGEFSNETNVGKNALLDEVAQQIGNLTTPYFVPTDPDQVTLPVVFR